MARDNNFFSPETEINVSKKDLWNFAVQNGMIDETDIQNKMDEMKKEAYLQQHNHKIWQGEQDKKWYTYLDDDSKRGYSLKVRQTKEELDDLLVKYYKDKENDPMINQVFHSWNDERLYYEEISVQSYNKYNNVFKRFFTGDCLVCQKKIRLITEEDLEDFIKEAVHKYGLSRKSYNDLKTVIRGIFTYAKKHHFTTISVTNFFGDLGLPSRMFKKYSMNEKEEVFNEDEVVMVKTYLKDHPTIRNLGILLAFQTGCRVGELCALKKEDFNRDRQTLHVQRTEIIYRNNGKSICEVQDFPKTEAGDRYIILPKEALDTLDMILAFHTDSDYLFWENGKRIRANAFNRRLTRVCDDLEIPHRSMHKIRKSYGTTLLDHKVADSLVADQMGHKDVSTTRKYYYFCNLTDETKRKQIEDALSC